MISKEEFRKALVVIDTYLHQIEEKKFVSKTPSKPGCRVKLSKFGLQMQGKRKAKLRGTTIDFNQHHLYPPQGTVTVKWDGIKKPDSMDISQIEPE